MPNAKRWQLATPIPRPVGAGHDLLLLPTFVEQILYNRGITTLEGMTRFLSDEGGPVYDPFLLKGMHQAVDRIIWAIGQGEPIVVYGDFDADGITSTALLVECLQALGADVEPYIPHRLEEGYGLNSQALQSLARAGKRLVITVDCGVSSIAEVTNACAWGLDVIITDHHHIPKALPPALAIINPKQLDCRYPFKDLAGVGVAYKLAQALYAALDVPQAERPVANDLVALGTVADLAPLIEENRALVKRGLQALNPPHRPGLQAMLQTAGVDRVDAWTIGFILGPRLNAMGRLEHAIASYRLLLTDSWEEALSLARKLEATNQERQRLTNELQEKARQEILERGAQEKLILVAGSDYPLGIVGLVAGRLAEELYRPVLVVGLGEKESRGSARSIAEFNIIAALEECRDLLLRYGGHAQAAGFTIETCKLDHFHLRLCQIAQRDLANIELQPTLFIDVELPLTEITWDTLRWLEKLAPFGYANPAPVFMSRRVRLYAPPRVVGKDHLRLKLAQHNSRLVLDAIGFRLAHLQEALSKHPYWDVAYTLEENRWGDQPPVLQLNIKDMKPSSI